MSRVKDHFHDEIQRNATAFGDPSPEDMNGVDKSCIGARIDGRGHNMGLCSGRAVYPLDMRVSDITLYDLAASLARICRYNGHLADHVGHYSVAQHSVHVSLIVEDELAALDVTHQDWIVRQAFLHDAPEYTMGDMIRPLKVEFPEYNALEEKTWRVIAQRFDLPFEMHPLVKWADNVALATEIRDIRNPGCLADKGALLPPDPVKIVPLESLQARHLFLRRAQELGIT